MSFVEVVYDAFVTDPLQLDIQPHIFQAWLTGITQTEVINELHTTLTKQFTLYPHKTQQKQHTQRKHHHNTQRQQQHQQQPQQQRHTKRSTHGGTPRRKGVPPSTSGTTGTTSGAAVAGGKPGRVSISSSSSSDSDQPSPSSTTRPVLSPASGSPNQLQRRGSKSHEGRSIIQALQTLQLNNTEEQEGNIGTATTAQAQPTNSNTPGTAIRNLDKPPNNATNPTMAEEDSDTTDSDDDLRTQPVSSSRHHPQTTDSPALFSSSAASPSSSSLSSSFTAAYSRLLLASQHQIHSQYRTFVLLEHILKKPSLLIQPEHSLFQLSTSLLHTLCQMYYQFNAAFYREFIGAKVRKIPRSEVDMMSSRCGIRMISGVRQFDNLKRIYRYRWPEPEEVENVGNNPALPFYEADVDNSSRTSSDNITANQHTYGGSGGGMSGGWKNVRGVAASFTHAMKSASMSAMLDPNTDTTDEKYQEPLSSTRLNPSSSPPSLAGASVHSTVLLLSSSFNLPISLARHYTQMVFLCHYRFNTSTKKMLSCRFDDLMIIAQILMQHWCIPVDSPITSSAQLLSINGSSLMDPNRAASASMTVGRLFSAPYTMDHQTAGSMAIMDRQGSSIGAQERTQRPALNVTTFTPPTPPISTTTTAPGSPTAATTAPVAAVLPIVGAAGQSGIRVLSSTIDTPSPILAPPPLLGQRSSPASSQTNPPASTHASAQQPSAVERRASGSETAFTASAGATKRDSVDAGLDIPDSAALMPTADNEDVELLSDHQLGDVLNWTFIEQLRAVKVHIVEQRRLMDDYTTAVLNILRDASYNYTHMNTTSSTPTQQPTQQQHVPQNSRSHSVSLPIQSPLPAAVPSMRPMVLEKIRPRVLPLLRVLLGLAASLGKGKKLRALFVDLQEDVCKIGHKNSLSSMEMTVMMTAIQNGFAQVKEVKHKLIKGEQVAAGIEAALSSPPHVRLSASMPPSPHSLVASTTTSAVNTATTSTTAGNTTSAASSGVAVQSSAPVSLAGWNHYDDELVRCYLHWQRFLAAVVPITSILYQRMFESQ